jgi:hypothetical protein
MGVLSSGQSVQGFPFAFGGDRLLGASDHVGPASYVTVTNATNAPGGGDTLYASEMGLKQIERVLSGMSDDGQYIIVGQGVPGGFPQNAVLMWIVANTGAQVANGVNLSARTAKILAIGR